MSVGQDFDFGLLAEGGFPLRTLATGEKVFAAEDKAEHLFVVKSGRVEIVAFGTVLDVIGPGGIFGEMALIDGGVRSASAVAAEPSEVAPVNREAFVFLVGRNPDFALQVMRVLVKRIRGMNESL
ncbi:MAG: Crp/Fnr family transcriptional regulator [Hyphomicrobiaceae bacterium]